jgi:hypothetical protein
MVGTVEIGSPLSHGLNYVMWLIHLWRQWRGCLMRVFPWREAEGHLALMKTIIERNLEMRILVSAMDSIISGMAVEDMVVVAVLILMISVVAVVYMGIVHIGVMYDLKMKSLTTMMKRKGLMVTKIPSVMAGNLSGVGIIAGMLILKIGDIAVVIGSMKNRTILLVSS